MKLVCYGGSKQPHDPFIMQPLEGFQASKRGIIVNYKCGICKTIVHLEIEFE